MLTGPRPASKENKPAPMAGGGLIQRHVKGRAQTQARYKNDRVERRFQCLRADMAHGAAPAISPDMADRLRKRGPWPNRSNARLAHALIDPA